LPVDRSGIVTILVTPLTLFLERPVRCSGDFAALIRWSVGGK
jgi:hypothetical protein